MLTQKEPLIGGVDNDCIVQFTDLLQIIEQPSDILVHSNYGGQIVAHVLLVFPTNQRITFQIATAILRDTLCIDRIPLVLYDSRHTLINLIKTIGSVFQHFLTSQQLQVPIISQRMFNRHILFFSRTSSAFIDIEKRTGFRKNRVIEHSQMTGSRHPVPMRSFLMEHHTKRSAFVPVLQILNRFICDNIGYIALLYHMLTIFNKIGIIVIALLMLTTQDAPVIKALRLGYQVPLTDY